MIANIQHVEILSNLHPDLWYRRWDGVSDSSKEAIGRRFDEIVEYKYVFFRLLNFSIS